MAKIPCKAATETGAPCRAPAGPSGFCFFHANPSRASELGRIGGRKNRSKLPETPAASSMTAADLRDIYVETIRDLRANKISPRVAGASAQVGNSLHRALPTADLEDRLARLEQQLAELKSQASADAHPARSRRQDETLGATEAQPDDVDAKEIGDVEQGGSNGSDEGGEE